MIELSKWNISEETKEIYIKKMTQELQKFRIMLGLSQSDIANLVGISRQTYSAIETKKREMSWSTYLTLATLFSSNETTSNAFFELNIFPNSNSIAEGLQDYSKSDEPKIPLFCGTSNNAVKMIQSLDEKGIHALETVLLLEYARCTNQSGEAIIRSYNGNSLSLDSSREQLSAYDALMRIRGSGNE